LKVGYIYLFLKTRGERDTSSGFPMVPMTI
jgi:hypothetical protein